MNIKKVAARAKVSIATVSRTVNGSVRVKPRTAEKVWQAVKQLGYFPNTQARSLVSGRSRTFGLIISDIVNPFFPELVKGFEDTAILHRYEVMVANTGYDAGRMALAVRRMIERKVDGVAVMTSETNPGLFDEVLRRRLPIVFLDVGQAGQRMTNIRVDYSAGIHEAVRHLVGLQHRRIGFISGPRELKSARARRKAFAHALIQALGSADEALIVEGDHKVEGGDSAMARLLAQQRPPTAVLASNDLTAIGALRAVHRAGLQVPQDISLIGFDDIELSRYTQPPLSTIRLSRDELGQKAFEALFDMAERKKHGQQFVVRTTLVVRESTAPARPLGKRTYPTLEAPYGKFLLRAKSLKRLVPGGGVEPPRC